VNWLHRGDYLQTDDGRFVINKATVCGLICYTAVKLGKPWRAGRDGQSKGWDGSEILHVERELDPTDEAARRDAIGRCKEACDRVRPSVPDQDPARV
jgi:hypothetical protein